jgi:CBS domain-containing protein
LLIIGGALGALVGHWLPGDAGLWALLGMAAVMSAAMRAPLTAAVFAIELTGCLDALPSTVAAAAASYGIAVLILRRSILTEKISRRGRHITQEYVVDPLAVTQVRDIMTLDPESLPAEMRVSEVLIFFASEGRHRTYPVVNVAGQPVGLVSRADVLRWQVTDLPDDPSLDDLLSDRSLSVGHPEMPATMIADLMVAEDVGRVPIVNRASGKLVGLVARRDLLQARAGRQHEENHRQRFVRPRASVDVSALQ